MEQLTDRTIAVARMAMKKMQATMEGISKTVGYGYAPPDEVLKAEGGNLDDLEKELNGLVEDLGHLDRVVKDFVAVNTEAPSEIPDEVFDMINEIKKSVPSAEELKKMVKEVVQEEMSRAV